MNKNLAFCYRGQWGAPKKERLLPPKKQQQITIRNNNGSNSLLSPPKNLFPAESQKIKALAWSHDCTLRISNVVTNNNTNHTMHV